MAMKNKILPLMFSFYLIEPTYSWGVCDEPLANQIVEVSETEAKFLVPDLSKLPRDIIDALQTGNSHGSVLRRGLVVQEYLPVTDEKLKSLFLLLGKAGIPFGTKDQRVEFLLPDKAKEIRMMSKSIKIGEKKTVIFQATIKGAGGLSVEQLETPENLTEKQLAEIKLIFEFLRPSVDSVVRKVYFELLATDHQAYVPKATEWNCIHS